MYVTYLTIYFGDKLPRRYIGSTSRRNIERGYNGSVSSKKYKEIYKQEQKENKHLFKTRILSSFLTRKEALEEELRIQIKYNVVKDVNYMNRNVSSALGAYGRDVKGELNPNFGKTASDDTREKQRLAAANRKIITCPHCGVESTTPNLMIRWHFDNCKSLNKQLIYSCTYCDVTSTNKSNITRHHNDNCVNSPNYNEHNITCDVCGFQSRSQGNMKRWHFENCKFNNK